MTAVIEKLIRDIRTSVDRLEAHLQVAGLDVSREGAPVPPVGEEAVWFRWWSLLDDLAERGGRVHRSALHEIARSHYDDLRALGGFFGGKGATLRYEGETACLTDYGREMVAKWEPTFRLLKQAR